MLEVKINPVSVFPDTATTLRVVGVQVRKPGAGGSAMINWQLLTEKGTPVKGGGVPLEGTDYDGWGSDDGYLVKYVLGKLGLTVTK